MFDLSAKLDELAQQGLYRSRRIVESPQGVDLIIDGKKTINFCSNDYLGLASHPKLIEAYKAALNEWGVGGGAAHLICGHSSPHHALEEELAEFTGRDRALLFSTGYMANLGVISALLGRGDTILEDRLNHASLLDGGLLSGATLKRYAHADCGHLAKLLAVDPFEKSHNKPDRPGPAPQALPSVVEGRREEANRLIVTDGVFSMDGDIAPLPELANLVKQHGAWLMVDDAHGFGVLGEHGGGLLEETGLTQNDVQVLVGTLGKAFGTFGAFVAGSNDLIETLIQSARTYIYTTALPPAIAEATRASLRIIQAESWRREKLRALTERFRQGAEQLGLTLTSSTTPIQPVLIGDSETAMKISNALFEKGFLVSAIRPPTVPKYGARLRVTFSAEHEEQDVDHLLAALSEIVT